MKKKALIGLLIALTLISVCSAEQVKLENVYSFFVDVHKDDQAYLKNITAEMGIITTFPVIPKDYSVKVIGHNGKVLFDKDIEVSFEILLDPIDVLHLNSTTIHIRVPVGQDATEIRIYHFDKSILDIDLSKEICNNNLICETGENKYNCSEDCRSKNFPFLAYLLIVAVLFGLVFLIFKAFRK